MRFIYTALLLIILISCKGNNNEMNTFDNIKDAQNYVTQSFNKKEETLLISDKLNDGVGLNMAIITNGILKKGYMPDGFEQKDGYRIYKFKKE